MNIKIRNKLRKILLPFFPEDRLLRKKWWHKWVKILTVIIAATSIYTVLWMSFLFFLMPKSWMNSPIYPTIYHISYLLAYIPINITSWLSQFRAYGIFFHAMLPIPIIGPLLFIFILIGILYLTPSLLYRLGIYLSHNLHRGKVKIIFFASLFIIGYFLFSTWKYQQLIDEGSYLSDQHCLKINPLTISRKNAYIDSMKSLQANNIDDYWTQTNKYLDFSKQYVEAEKTWLTAEKTYMEGSDYKTFVPSYIQKGGQFQYDSYEAQMKTSEAINELFATYKTASQQRQKELNDIIIAEVKRSNDADDAYNKLANDPKKPFDLRDYFTTVPVSKCPEENFNIPDVQDELLNPPKIPANSPMS